MDDKIAKDLVHRAFEKADDDFNTAFNKFINIDMEIEEKYMYGMAYIAKTMEQCISTALLVDNEEKIDRMIMMAAAAAAERNKIIMDGINE